MMAAVLHQEPSVRARAAIDSDQPTPVSIEYFWLQQVADAHFLAAQCSRSQRSDGWNESAPGCVMKTGG